MLTESANMYHVEKTTNTKFIVKYGLSASKAFCVDTQAQYDALLCMKNEPVKYLICTCKLNVTLPQLFSSFPELELLELDEYISTCNFDRMPDRIIYFSCSVMDLHTWQLSSNLKYLAINELVYDEHAVDLPTSLMHMQIKITVHRFSFIPHTICTLNPFATIQSIPDVITKSRYFCITLKRKHTTLFDSIEFNDGHLKTLRDMLIDEQLPFVVPFNQIRRLVDIDFAVWPADLKILKMSIDTLNDHLPNNLEKLVYDNYVAPNPSIFMHLPESLIHLSMLHYNGPLQLPSGLKYLKLNEYHYQALHLPNTLEYLYLPRYNFKINQVFPLSLHTIYLPQYREDIPPIPYNVKSVVINH